MKYNREAMPLRAILMPLLTLVIVILLGELAFRVTGDFGLVVPYKDYLERFDMRHKVSGSLKVRGDYWAKDEIDRVAEFNGDGYHAPKHNLRVIYANKSLRKVFLFGDSITESITIPLDKTFYSLVDRKYRDLVIIPRYIIANTLEGVNFLLESLDTSRVRSRGRYKGYVVAQLRPLSYRGVNLMMPLSDSEGNVTEFRDLGMPVDKNEQYLSVMLKRLILAKLNFAKLSDFYQTMVFGQSHFLSFLVYRYKRWHHGSITNVPNNETFFVDKDTDEKYWVAFEKTLVRFKNLALEKGLKPAILLAPGSPRNDQWIKRFSYTKELTDVEKKYQELFTKHHIPYDYPIEDFYEASKSGPVFWGNDGHPNLRGNEALALGLERLLRKTDQGGRR